MVPSTDSLRRSVERLRRGSSLDAAVQAELQWQGVTDVLPSGLELTWLGTAGFRLAVDGTVLLIDPYATRRDLATTVRRAPLLSDEALVRRHLGEADAVLVGHTHFDHAVDVPALARSGAAVYGSTSARTLLGVHGLADRAVVVEPHQPIEIGPFTVTFVPSTHSKLALGLTVPQGGELTCDHIDGLWMGSYRCGQVWGIAIEVAGTTIYHQGSADVLDDEVRHHDIDVFLCGIAGRRWSPRYLERVLGLLRPRVVVPHHHDDFFRPLDAPMGFSLNVHLRSACEDLASIDSDVQVRTLTPLVPVSG